MRLLDDPEIHVSLILNHSDALGDTDTWTRTEPKLKRLNWKDIGLYFIKATEFLEKKVLELFLIELSISFKLVPETVRQASIPDCNCERAKLQP